MRSHREANFIYKQDGIEYRYVRICARSQVVSIYNHPQNNRDLKSFEKVVTTIKNILYFKT